MQRCDEVDGCHGMSCHVQQLSPAQCEPNDGMLIGIGHGTQPHVQPGDSSRGRPGPGERAQEAAHIKHSDSVKHGHHCRLHRAVRKLWEWLCPAEVNAAITAVLCYVDVA